MTRHRKRHEVVVEVGLCCEYGQPGSRVRPRLPPGDRDKRGRISSAPSLGAFSSHLYLDYKPILQLVWEEYRRVDRLHYPQITHGPAIPGGESAQRRLLRYIAKSTVKIL